MVQITITTTGGMLVLLESLQNWKLGGVFIKFSLRYVFITFTRVLTILKRSRTFCANSMKYLFPCAVYIREKVM